MNKSVIRGLAGVAAVVAIGLTGGVAAGGGQGYREISFMPDNDLDQEDNLLAPTGITETQFNNTINHIKSFYTSIVSRHGGRLVVNALWTNSTVNASASRSGSTWTVNMYGGLARRSEVTAEGFAVVMCHELGHHLGGYFFYGSADWASAEGQSDWFATQACARKIWAADAQGNAPFRTSTPQVLRSKCDAEWDTVAQQNLCYRVASGGLSAATLLGALGGTTVNPNTTDPTVVTRTSTSHPRAQCRLDTYTLGALCTVTHDDNVIPGLSLGSGRNSANAEREAGKTRCLPVSASLGTPGYNGKDMPKCWFKPLVSAFGVAEEE